MTRYVIEWKMKGNGSSIFIYQKILLLTVTEQILQKKLQYNFYGLGSYTEWCDRNYYMHISSYIVHVRLLPTGFTSLESLTCFYTSYIRWVVKLYDLYHNLNVVLYKSLHKNLTKDIAREIIWHDFPNIYPIHSAPIPRQGKEGNGSRL